MNRNRHIISLRWLAKWSLIVAFVCWATVVTMIRTADPAQASEGYLDCLSEDSRNCAYDSQHQPKYSNDWAPWNFYVGGTGKVWRLPHHLAHTLILGSDTVYRACPTEDSIGCVWRANVRGNQQGDSFWTGWHGRVWPIPHHIAAELVQS